MAIWGAIIGAAIQVGTMVYQGSKKKKEEELLRDANSNMDSLISGRQEITNPYAGVTATTLKDRTGEVKNPYSNLRISTKAAQMQRQVSEDSLASMQRTVERIGSGAGGATALAMAAKQGAAEVSATIEQQEADNQKLYAQGEAQKQNQILSMKMQMDSHNASEAARVQSAQAQGKQFMWQQQDEREWAELDRAQAEIDESKLNINAQNEGMMKGMGNLAGFAGDIAGG